MVEPSKNAVAQAVRRLHPELTRNRMFAILELPHCRMTHTRYWAQTYHILPWSQRSEEERSAATAEAQAILDFADKMYASGWMPGYYFKLHSLPILLKSSPSVMFPATWIPEWIDRFFGRLAHQAADPGDYLALREQFESRVLPIASLLTYEEKQPFYATFRYTITVLEATGATRYAT